jgi:hypothetical protein
MIQLNSDVLAVILEYTGYYELCDLLDELYPGCKQLCYKRNIKKIITYDQSSRELCKWGNEVYIYKLFDKIHREEDLPAVEYINGDKHWFNNGKLHRTNDKPAIECISGNKYWLKNGKLHRDKDLPAIVEKNGARRWYKDGKKYGSTYM